MIDSLYAQGAALDVAMLHIAPEPFFSGLFRKRFGHYVTGDLSQKDVDYRFDLAKIPFGDASFDVVFASHVLEHIANDYAAIAEIRRILKPGGIAILPVPIVCARTIEYTEPNPAEGGHVRAPGPDYYDRYGSQFARVELWTSASVPEKYQTFIYEDRTVWPTRECPNRTPMSGVRHSDLIPICYV